MNLKEELAQGRTLVFDGAMGTYFASLPGHTVQDCERANLDHPEEVLSIHRAYLEAGCRAIKTNTFSAGALAAEGMTELTGTIIDAGCRLALEAAQGRDAYVFADIGPAPQLHAGYQETCYCWLMDRFLKNGIRHFLIETLPSDEGVAEAARYLKRACPEAFLLVSYAVQPGGATREGLMGRTLLRRTAQLPQVDAVGLNCVSGPNHMLKFVRELEVEGLCLSVMPNAGYPTVLGRRTVYKGKPDYFAQKMIRVVQAGASIVGGCCGTTPAHIAQLVRALREPLPAELPPPIRPQAPAPAPAKSSLWDKLSAGEKVIAVELDPPKDDGIQPFLDGAKLLTAHGADSITIADCPVGRPRADSSLLACKLHRELGIDPLPHLTCRDRNLNASKALLLGLAIEGVHNVLLVTGDPVPTESRDEVKSVFNFNSRKLARYVSELGTEALSTPFHIFGALNVNSRSFHIQLRLAQEKEECGVAGFLTQPILSPEALENLRLARAALKGKILAGIFPPVSYRNACFLNNEISGIRVCDQIMDLYRDADRAESEALALTIATEIARAAAPDCDGFYVMTPFQRVGLVASILDQLRAL